MDYIFLDIAALLGLLSVPVLFFFLGAFLYLLRLRLENEELRRRLAKYEHPEIEPEWVQWLFSDDSDPRIPSAN